MFYKNLLYKYYRFAIALGNDGFYPEVLAFGLATMMVWFNFLSVLYLAEYFKLLSKSVSVVFVYSTFLFWIAGFVYLVLMEKYESIISLLDKESESIKRKKTVLISVYSVITIAVYFYVAEL